MLRSAKRKGQSLVIEEMMMFSIGIFVIAGVIFLLNLVNESVLDFVQHDQAEEINSYLKAYVEALGRMDCTDCHVTVKIPEKIGGSSYNLLGEGTQRRILIYNIENELWNEKNVSFELVGLIQGDDYVQFMMMDDGSILMRGVNNY